MNAAIPLALAVLLFPVGAAAAAEGAPHLDGGTLGLVWVIPFVCCRSR
jgi:hypothetical protein